MSNNVHTNAHTSYEERLKHVVSYYPRPDFSKGEKIAMVFPAYTPREKNAAKEAYLRGLIKDDRTIYVDSQDDYEYIVQRLAATPLSSDIEAVVTAMASGPFVYDNIEDAIIAVTDASGVPVEVVAYIFEDMAEFLLVHKSGDKILLRINMETSSIDPPTKTELDLIKSAINTMWKDKLYIPMNEISIATGIQSKRLYDINTYQLVKNYIDRKNVNISILKGIK